MKECPFCKLPQSKITASYKYFNAIYDEYPVSKGHTLVISKRCVSSYFELTNDEKYELVGIIDSLKNRLSVIFNPLGFNIGFNDGFVAGQSVPHFHLHIIPRYFGDMDDPKGGVRGVIPEKQKY